MDGDVPWTWFLLAAVGLLVVSMGASAVLAPSVTTAEPGDEETRILVGSHGGGPGLHDDGSVYELEGGEISWREASADSVFEVERRSDGTVVYAFANSGVEDCGPYESPCGRTGYRVLDPDGPSVVDEYSFPVRDIGNSEVHVAQPLPDGSIALVDMDQERLLVRENGSTVWEWRADSFYDEPADPTQVDWLHINDVDYLGDDRFLVSVRNANQLLVVERGEGVVEVVNEDRSADDDDACTGGGQLEDYDGDGDVRCGDPSVIDHQHNPHWLGNDTVLVADSDNGRVVELRRNDEGHWEPVWALYEAGGVEFSWPRDADRLPNGNTLVTDTMNSRIVEVTEDGEVVRSISTPEIPYEADVVGVNNSTRLPTYDAEESIDDPDARTVPVLSRLVFYAHTAVPALPFWYGEAELVATLLAALLVVGGVVQYYRQREGPSLVGRIRERTSDEG